MGNHPPGPPPPATTPVDSHTHQRIYTATDTQRNIPSKWTNENDDDVQTIDSAWGCCWCIVKCLCMTSLFFGYFVGSIVLSSLSPMFGCGLFVTIGLWCVTVDVFAAQRDGQVLREYQHQGACCVQGTIIDRNLQWQEVSTTKQGPEHAEVVVARTLEARYTVLVEYKVGAPTTTAPTTTEWDNHRFNNNNYTSGTDHNYRLHPPDNNDVVVQKAFSVTKEIYDGDQHVNVLVLPHNPKSGLLQVYATPANLSYHRGERRARFWWGVGFLITAILIAVLVAVLGDDYSDFGMLDLVACCIQGTISVIVLASTYRNSAVEAQDLKSGQRTARIVPPTGGRVGESLATSIQDVALSSPPIIAVDKHESTIV